MSKDEFIEKVKLFHLQNLSGREDFAEAFEMGIGAAWEESTGVYGRVEAKDKYRVETNKDVYSNGSSSYSDDYVKWLELRVITL